MVHFFAGEHVEEISFVKNIKWIKTKKHEKNNFYSLMFTVIAVCCFSINAQNFVHPGGLVTQDDIDRIQYLKDVEQDATIVAAFNKLQANSHAKSAYNPNPQVHVDRGGTEFSDNYSIAMNDAVAAYQNARMWRITDITAHADCTVRILNGWARTCKDIRHMYQIH
jgi:hypothetical protein